MEGWRGKPALEGVSLWNLCVMLLAMASRMLAPASGVSPFTGGFSDGSALGLKDGIRSITLDWSSSTPFFRSSAIILRIKLSSIGLLCSLFIIFQILQEPRTGPYIWPSFWFVVQYLHFSSSKLFLLRFLGVFDHCMVSQVGAS